MPSDRITIPHHRREAMPDEPTARASEDLEPTGAKALIRCDAIERGGTNEARD